MALVYADYLAIDDRGRPLSEPGFRFHNRARPSDPEIHLPRTLDEFFARGDNCIGPCFMYRGWVGGLLGDYDAEMGVEDYDYWLRIGLNFRIAHLGTRETLYQYRVHDDSLSGRAAQLRLTGDCERLMAYHARRQDYCKKPWTIHVDDATWEKIKDCAAGPHQFVPWPNPGVPPSLAAEKNLFLVCAASLKAVADLRLPEGVAIDAWFGGEPSEPYRFRIDARRAKAACFTPCASTAQRLRLLDAPTIEFQSWVDLVPLAVRRERPLLPDPDAAADRALADPPRGLSTAAVSLSRAAAGGRFHAGRHGASRN